MAIEDAVLNIMITVKPAFYINAIDVINLKKKNLMDVIKTYL